MFYQFSKLVFFPVVDVSYRSWQDLDGEPFTFHARGTGTEAMGDLIAAREGITFGRRSYVPGSENRVVALLQGTISATILDLANTKLLLEQAPDRFHVLPGIDIPPSDEVLSARQEWLDDNAEAAQILMTHAWALIFLLFAFALLASEGIGLIEKTQRVRSSARQ
jgi:NitT/TauT family transport system substrate-binding protein